MSQTLAGSYRYLLKLLSWRMIAARVLFVTHSSSLVIPSGRAPRQRCRGSMFLFTKGMAHNLELTNTYDIYRSEIKSSEISVAHIPAFFSRKYFTNFRSKPLLQPSHCKILYNSYRGTGVLALMPEYDKSTAEQQRIQAI